MKLPLAVAVLTSVAFVQGAFVEHEKKLSCVAECTTKASEQCNNDSLDRFIHCLDHKCLTPRANISLSITPKMTQSCNDSLSDDTWDSEHTLYLNGAGTCVNGPYHFRSFNATVDPSSHVKSIRKHCKMKVYDYNDCVGHLKTLGLSEVKMNGCTKVGGKSFELHCGPLIGDHDALRSLETICSNATSNPGKETPHRPSAHSNTTATASGTSTSASSHSPSQKPPMSPITGLASSEHELNPSFVALLGVIAAAMAML